MAQSDDRLQALLATVERLERNQERFTQVAEGIVSTLEVMNEKLDAVLSAAVQEPGPSPLVATLAQIATALRDQEKVLLRIPGMLAQTIREEMQRELVDDEDHDGDTLYEPADDGHDRPQ